MSERSTSHSLSSHARGPHTSWKRMMFGWTSFLWLTISRSVFLLRPPPCVRGTHLAATMTLVFLLRISFMVPAHAEISPCKVTSHAAQHVTLLS